MIIILYFETLEWTMSGPLSKANIKAAVSEWAYVCVCGRESKEAEVVRSG